jgi:hypothetical protein
MEILKAVGDDDRGYGDCIFFWQFMRMVVPGF